MNRRTLGRLCAPVILSLGLLAVAATPAFAGQSNPGAGWGASTCVVNPLVWNSISATAYVTNNGAPVQICDGMITVLCGTFGGGSSWAPWVEQATAQSTMNITQRCGTGSLLNICVAMRTSVSNPWIVWNENRGSWGAAC